MGLIVDFLASFGLGLLTPLTAACVLPLYPGFLAFLSAQFKGGSGIEEGNSKKLLIMFGVIIVLGVIVFMLLLGLIFTTILQESLTSVIGIISPIAFGILGIISILLIFNLDFGRFFPKFRTPAAKNPLLNAFIFGFFFGAIVIPCNPAFIAAFFTRAFLMTEFISSMVNFLAFGLGLGASLLVLAIISAQWSQGVIGFLTRHKRAINFLAGIIMLGISAYYLFFVFRIHELII